MNNQLATKEKFSTFLNSTAVQKQIESTLGSSLKKERFTTSIVSAVANNPMLRECSNTSIYSAALLGESLGLSPSPQLGHYFLVPFNNKKLDIKEAQFQLGYKGYIQLALRSGQYIDIDVLEIREGEYKGRDSKTGKAKIEFIENEELRETLRVVGYYAYIEMKNGMFKSVYWSHEKMLNHADLYSQAFSKKSYQELLAGKIAEKEKWKYSSFWYKDFDQMAFKTLLRNIISKWGTLSIDFQTALEKDMTISGEYKDNPQYMKDVINVTEKQEDLIATTELEQKIETPNYDLKEMEQLI